MNRSAWFRLSAAGLAAVLLAAWAGCEEQSAGPIEPSAARRANGVIAFVGAGVRNPLWAVLKASAERYDREMCALQVDYLCPKGDSPQDQIDLLKGLTNRQLRGVCIQLENVPALEPTLQDLYTRGIIIVSMIKPAPEAVRVAHVGFDEIAVGEDLAAAAAQAVGDEGTLMILHAGTKDLLYGLRLAGFDREIVRHGQVKVLAEVNCQMDPTEARSQIADRFARYPRLSAWIALDDWPLRGLSLTDRPLPSGCRLVTFGGYPDQWPFIRDGSCPAVVAANYRELGAKALQMCEIATRYPGRPKETYLAPLRTVHRLNLDAYIRDWSSWLQPEQ